MNLSPLPRLCALALAISCLGSLAAFAEDATPVVVTSPLPDLTVSAGTSQSTIKLNATFGLTGVTGKIERLTFTSFSLTDGTLVSRPVDVELFKSVAPVSVANFLSYANNGTYNNSFIHRSVPGFIIQGGGYRVDNGAINRIDTAATPTIVGEHTISNTRGTLTYALSDGPDSATTEWFFNLVDNTSTTSGSKINLDDTSDGGPFTVFGRVIGDGMNTVDGIAALQVINIGAPYDALPVLSSYNSSVGPTLSDVVYLTQVAAIPLTPKPTGGPAILKLKVKANSNPSLVTPKITGRKLYLSYAAGQTGSSTITVMAKNPLTKSKALSSFTVTVK